MKIITKILNNYFTKIYINEILESVRCNFMLDNKVEIDKQGNIKIMFKPLHYNTYTLISYSNKEDSLVNLIAIKTTDKKTILNRIKDIEEHNTWNRRNEK